MVISGIPATRQTDIIKNGRHEWNHCIGPGRETPAQKIPHFTLEVYDKIPIFVTVYITEDVVKLIMQKRLGGLGPGGMYSKALTGWVLKFGEYSKNFAPALDFFNWLSYQIPPWQVYCSFMSVRLIDINNQPGMISVGLREIWYNFLLSVCWRSWNPKPSTQVRMNRFVTE